MSDRPDDREVGKWFMWLQSKLKDRFTELRRAFRAIDEDCNGFLSYEEFRAVFDIFALPVPDNVFQRIVELIDKDGDKHVTFAEFAKLVGAANIRELA